MRSNACIFRCHECPSFAILAPFTALMARFTCGRFFITNCAFLRLYRTPTGTPRRKPHHFPTLAQTDKKPAFRCAFLMFFSGRHWCPRMVHFPTLIGVQMCFILPRFWALHEHCAAPVQARAATNLAPAPEIASQKSPRRFPRSISTPHKFWTPVPPDGFLSDFFATAQNV